MGARNHENEPQSNRQPDYQRYTDGEPRFFTREQKAIALERQGYVCPICHRSVGMDGSCHHMCMFSQGGSTSVDNLIVVHPGKCHQRADQISQQRRDVVSGSVFVAEETQVRSKTLWERIWRR